MTERAEAKRKNGVPASPSRACASHRAADASRPKASPANARCWHLVCVTRKGKVSMLQNLTLEMARETYKKLMPGTHPEKHYPPKCMGGKPQSCMYRLPCKSHPHRNGMMSYGSVSNGEREDHLQSVEVLGPKGLELNPWSGVKPNIIRHHCFCEAAEKAAADKTTQTQVGLTRATVSPFLMKLAELSSAAPPKPHREHWPKSRTDFWNHPRLWDRVKDPFRQMCWEMVR